MRTFAHVLGLLAAITLSIPFAVEVAAPVCIPTALVLLFGYAVSLEHSSSHRRAGR